MNRDVYVLMQKAGSDRIPLAVYPTEGIADACRMIAESAGMSVYVVEVSAVGFDFKKGKSDA